jgi:hypothetical protein
LLQLLQHLTQHLLLLHLLLLHLPVLRQLAVTVI